MTVDMPKLDVLFERAVERSIDQTLFKVEEVAKRNAPVDTGFFRNNIKASLSDRSVTANASYSAALEYGVTGTSRQPRPTMRNAARAGAAAFNDIFKRNFR